MAFKMVKSSNPLLWTNRSLRAVSLAKESGSFPHRLLLLPTSKRSSFVRLPIDSGIPPLIMPSGD
ncbi:hypothetical protein D3C72_2326020 [compost metagenome]